MADTSDALDEAIRVHAAESMRPGDVAVTWYVVVGVQSFDASGHSVGRVVPLMPGGSAVPWLVKGLLHDALDNLDATTEDADE